MKPAQKKEKERVVIDNDNYQVEIGEDISIPVISENYVDIRKPKENVIKNKTNDDKKK